MSAERRPLSRAFLQRLGAPALDVGPGELEAQLKALHGAGRATWPEIEVPAVRFIEHVAERSPREAASQFLSTLHAADLYLACACLAHHRRALDELDRCFLVSVARQVARLDPAPAFRDEVCQILRVDLLVGDGRRPPKLTRYSGSGPLAGWLRVVGVRSAQKLRRRARPHLNLDQPGGELPLFEGDLELEYLKRRYGKAFRDAFGTALATLPSRDRAVLALHLLEGMSSAAIGKSYGVHGATVRLWIKKSRAAVLARMTELFQKEAGVSPEDLPSLLGLVRSQLDLTISRLLRAGV